MKIEKIEAKAQQPVIETPRFVMRPLQKSDAGLIHMYAADLRVSRNTRTIPHPYPPGAAEGFIARAQSDQRSEDVWALDGSSFGDAEFLGTMSLKSMDRAQSEIRYWIAPPFWSTGMATEAVRALVAANPHQAQRFFAEVFQDNEGSARVLTNCGFEYLGDAEAYSVARGAVVPTWTYTLKVSA